MNFIGCVLMAAITFPVSYLLARGCLRGLLRVVQMGQAGTVTGSSNRNVL
jgi:hypothetical protein